MDVSAKTPEQVMAVAAEGHLSKRELASLIAIERRQPFLDACAAIERQFTLECGQTTKAPCLDSGCAAAGEICLQPLLHAGSAYYKACAQVWLPIFAEPKNRAA